MRTLFAWGRIPAGDRRPLRPPTPRPTDPAEGPGPRTSRRTPASARAVRERAGAQLALELPDGEGPSAPGPVEAPEAVPFASECIRPQDGVAATTSSTNPPPGAEPGRSRGLREIRFPGGGPAPLPGPWSLRAMVSGSTRS